MNTRRQILRYGTAGLVTTLTATLSSCRAASSQTSTTSSATSVTDSSDFKPGLNRVTFQSEGVPIVGALFLPANYTPGTRLPVILIDGPWTQVKEQVGYRYGRALAEQGFATLAIDHRYWGESGGQPRSFESPRAKVQDLRNAVSFLQTVPAVDGNKIGGLGVCFGASYMMIAAAEDPRLKSVATTAAWLHDLPSIRQRFGAESYNQKMQAGQAALKKFQQSQSVERVPAASTTDLRAAMYVQDPAKVGDYYFNPQRGVMPQWKNEFATMSWVDWLNLDSINAIAPKITAPLLMVHSDDSALPDNVRKFHRLVKAPKDLYWTQGKHLDFYDRDPYVSRAVQALSNHFRNTMA